MNCRVNRRILWISPDFISFFTIQLNILVIKSNQQMIKTKASVRDNRRLLFFLYKWHICVLCIRKSFDTGFLFLDFFQGQKSVLMRLRRSDIYGKNRKSSNLRGDT